MLLELRASLKPGGVLFSSNPHGHNEEGGMVGATACIMILKLGAAICQRRGSLSLITIIAPLVCRANIRPG